MLSLLLCRAAIRKSRALLPGRILRDRRVLVPIFCISLSRVKLWPNEQRDKTIPRTRGPAMVRCDTVLFNLSHQHLKTILADGHPVNTYHIPSHRPLGANSVVVSGFVQEWETNGIWHLSYFSVVLPPSRPTTCCDRS